MKLENKEIIIDFELPKELRGLVDEITVYTNKYETDDDMPLDEYCAYISLVQSLEVTGKQYTSGGRISDSQKAKLFDKYNAWV